MGEGERERGTTREWAHGERALDDLGTANNVLQIWYANDFSVRDSLGRLAKYSFFASSFFLLSLIGFLNQEIVYKIDFSFS